MRSTVIVPRVALLQLVAVLIVGIAVVQMLNLMIDRSVQT